MSAHDLNESAHTPKYMFLNAEGAPGRAGDLMTFFIDCLVFLIVSCLLAGMLNRIHNMMGWFKKILVE